MASSRQGARGVAGEGSVGVWCSRKVLVSRIIVGAGSIRIVSERPRLVPRGGGAVIHPRPVHETALERTVLSHRMSMVARVMMSVALGAMMMRMFAETVLAIGHPASGGRFRPAASKMRGGRGRRGISVTPFHVGMDIIIGPAIHTRRAFASRRTVSRMVAMGGRFTRSIGTKSMGGVSRVPGRIRRGGSN